MSKMMVCEECQVTWDRFGTTCTQCGKDSGILINRGDQEPDEDFENEFEDVIGMSPRDWFAVRAMQAIIITGADCEGSVEYEEHVVARNAYLMADAMLEAREK